MHPETIDPAIVIFIWAAFVIYFISCRLRRWVVAKPRKNNVWRG
jgi:hypothetical protein